MIEQAFEFIGEADKYSALARLLEREMDGRRLLIFCETKRGCDAVTRQLRTEGWPALSIHGDKSQQERDWVLAVRSLSSLGSTSASGSSLLSIAASDCTDSCQQEGQLELCRKLGLIPCGSHVPMQQCGASAWGTMLRSTQACDGMNHGLRCVRRSSRLVAAQSCSPLMSLLVVLVG